MFLGLFRDMNELSRVGIQMVMYIFPVLSGPPLRKKRMMLIELSMAQGLYWWLWT